jgi:hypothetical protein
VARYDLVWGAVGILAAMFVYLDGRRLGVQYGGPSGDDSSLGRVGWAVMALLFPVIAVPLYVWRRRRYSHRISA